MSANDATEQLAVNGGPKVRETPFPKRAPFGEEEVALAAEAIRSQNLFRWSGHFVKDFEAAFAEFYGAPHAVAATSGTAAIHLAVGAVDPEPGDEIITAPITDFGSVAPILLQNAVPVFADIDETYNIDPEDVERRITDRTRAIIAVHLFGNACRLDALLDIARRHELVLIEDCSQAHATKYRGKYLGTWGDIGCFSMQQSKHLTTGDGGMAITNSPELYGRMWQFADKGYPRGRLGPRSYTFLAPCYRMNEVTAAVGLPQLKRVRGRVETRMRHGARLGEALAEVDGVLPAPVTEGSEHSGWAYPIRLERWTARRFGEALAAEGVPGMVGYTGLPIYMCSAALTEKRTYGASGFPFDSPYSSRDIRYDATLCPKAMAALDRMVALHFDEAYSDADIDDMARAIAKVARLLLPEGA